MKGIVVYDGTYGNTRKVAETISNTLKESGLGIDTFYVKDVKKLRAEDYDFFIFGSPTRWGTMSFTFKRFLGKIKNEEWANKVFAAFDTELPENIEKNEGSAAQKIADGLKEKQMKQLLPVLKAVVSGMKGPLRTGETERVIKYAMDLAAELNK